MWIPGWSCAQPNGRDRQTDRPINCNGQSTLGNNNLKYVKKTEIVRSGKHHFCCRLGMVREGFAETETAEQGFKG